jgi:hypothetical protein
MPRNTSSIPFPSVPQGLFLFLRGFSSSSRSRSRDVATVRRCYGPSMARWPAHRRSPSCPHTFMQHLSQRTYLCSTAVMGDFAASCNKK